MNFSTKLKSWFKKDWNETKTLFRCLPALPFAVLCAALIAMNILANKTIVNETWIALDAGICVSLPAQSSHGQSGGGRSAHDDRLPVPLSIE